MDSILVTGAVGEDVGVGTGLVGAGAVGVDVAVGSSVGTAVRVGTSTGVGVGAVGVAVDSGADVEATGAEGEGIGVDSIKDVGVAVAGNDRSVTVWCSVPFQFETPTAPRNDSMTTKPMPIRSERNGFSMTERTFASSNS